MSVESTNTPNGDSNSLYSKNEDKDNKIVLNFVDMSTRDPNNWRVPGDGIEVDGSKTVEISDLRENGFVRIEASLIGNPVKGQDKNGIVSAVEAVKARFLKEKNALTAGEYTKLKQKEKNGKEENGKEEKSEYQR